ncbi:hypothetical protein [Ciceribacter sp. L1K22]|uniref:hypothetical protein n=1 Tax=Ciceribacter sp. L1K22 TaxID=2820275 RepID=UPI001ABE748E|nr:hypothetical protein [Ciceribacter sp. L1K22]MBO3760205.1 hypothetical protein [Ciceribacter sp. L1K22]
MSLNHPHFSPDASHASRFRPLRTLLDIGAPAPVDRLPSPVTASDGLVIDVRDRAATEGTAGAAGMIANAWREAGGGAVLVRVRPVTAGDDVSDEIAIAAQVRADGIVQCGIRDGSDLQHLHSLMAVEEARGGLDQGALAIVAELGDTPLGVLQAASLAGKTPRLAALVFDPEALAAATGAREIGGSATLTGRGLALMAAASAGVPVFEALPMSVEYTQLGAICSRLQNDGMLGAMTRDADFVAPLRQGFGDAG